jgi:hypothetical protein
LSRKNFALVLGGIFLVTLMFGVVSQSLNPFFKWNLVTIGGTIGAAIIIFVISGIGPMIVWAFERFRAQKARGVLGAWAVIVVLWGILSLYGQHDISKSKIDNQASPAEQ